MRVNEAIQGEAVFFFTSFFVGVGLVLFYDVFRILRRVIKHGTVWIGIEDISFWVLCTAAVFLLLYRENDGMMRLFAFVGILFGMGVYLAVLSKFVIRIFVWILSKLLKGVQKVGRVLFGPIWKIIKKIVLIVKKGLKKWCKAIKMSLYKM